MAAGGERGEVGMGRRRLAVLLTLAALALGGCSVRKVAISKVADGLSGTGGVYTSDDDPELVRDALPFALKTFEGLLEEVPEHSGLLLATCRGFVLYSFAFVELEADHLEATDFRAARRQRDRAAKLYLRGLDYCYRAFDLRFPGVRQRLLADGPDAVQGARLDDVELLYWTALAWGAAISSGLDRPELVAEIPAARALMEAGKALDPDYERGAFHEAMMVIEAASPGGSPEKAREHYERAVELSGGQRASIFVSWATGVSVKSQDRKEFKRLLERALTIDVDQVPADRLANLIYQRKARLLLSQADELFLDDLDDLEDAG